MQLSNNTRYRTGNSSTASLRDKLQWIPHFRSNICMGWVFKISNGVALQCKLAGLKLLFMSKCTTKTYNLQHVCGQTTATTNRKRAVKLPICISYDRKRSIVRVYLKLTCALEASMRAIPVEDSVLRIDAPNTCRPR